ncbi:uncharacterized protein LOC133927209 [Phragmites australis]|uniref:uncharacterized protein LOC133927209 n=1 Tax=Phragmites australis TaxID=29695 RepID=UPI002D78D76D|nr:uncharacterized protein LOC133927209 [Phragmites australis]
MERAQAEDRAVANDGNGNHQEVAFADAGAMAWCGYLFVAASVAAICAGLTDTPGAALSAYALLLLGVVFISLAVLPLRPMERMLEEENRAVGNDNRQGDEVVVLDAGTMAWCGYLLAAAPVLATWAGLVDGPVATFFAYVLLLLGVASIGLSMLAPAKPKIA